MALLEVEPAIDAVPEGVPLGVGEGLREGVAEGVYVEDAVPVGEAPPDIDADGDFVTVGVDEGGELPEREGVGDGVSDPVAVGVNACVKDPEGVPEVEDPPDEVPVGVKLPLAATLPVVVPLALPVRVGEPVPDTEGVPDRVGEPDGVPNGEAPLDNVADAVGVREGVSLREPDVVLVRLPVFDGVADRVPETVPVIEGVPVPLSVFVGLTLAELPEEAVPEFEGVPLTVPERVKVPDAEFEAVPVGVGEGDRVVDGVPEDDADTVLEAERDVPAEADPVPVSVLEGVPESVPLGVDVGVPESVPDFVPVMERVPVWETVPLLDALAPTGSTNSPCVPRPVPKLRYVSAWPQHHTPALLCSAHAWVPPVMLTSMYPDVGAPAMEKSGVVAERVLLDPWAVMPSSVGVAADCAPTPFPAQRIPPVPLWRKQDARLPPEMGYVQFEKAPTGVESAAVHGYRAATLPTPCSPLPLWPQHTIEVGVLSRVAQLV